MTSPTRTPHAAHGTRHQQLTQQARKLVAQTFFGTLMKQMRDSPFKSNLFSGGRGGEAFGSLLDQRLADHMSRAAGNKLVQGIARRLEHRGRFSAEPGKLPRPAIPAALLKQSIHAKGAAHAADIRA